MFATVRLFSAANEPELEAVDLSEVLHIADGRGGDLQRVLTGDTEEYTARRCPLFAGFEAGLNPSNRPEMSTGAESR